MSKDISLRKIVNFLAFIGVIFVAIVIALRAFGFASGIAGALSTIAFFISLAVMALAAFFYARSKRNIGFMIAYIIAVVVILVTYFLA